MTSQPIPLPLRLGLIGLGRAGIHHLERISLRNDLKVVAASPCEDDHIVGVHPRAHGVFCEIDEMLRRDDLDFVLVAAPVNVRQQCVIRTLEAGKHVALEPPPFANFDQARTILKAAERTGRSLAVLPSRRTGFDFRAALQTARSGCLGDIEYARMISWAKAVPGDLSELEGAPDSSAQSNPAASRERAFEFFAFQYVDQLLQLNQRSPQSVFAKVGPPNKGDPSGAVFFLSIGFDGGSNALIDVNLHSGAALQTGWMIAGTKGAYCQQRVFLGDPSGEVCDAPVLPADVPDLDPYAVLLDAARNGAGTNPTACEAAMAMRVIDAASESSRRGEVIRIDESFAKDF